jgi:hypothetical protein
MNASLLACASTSSEKSYVFAVGYKRSKNYIHTDLRYILIYVNCTENPIYVFPEMKLRGLVPSSFIHVSVSDLYIPRIDLPIWLQHNRQADPGNI